MIRKKGKKEHTNAKAVPSRSTATGNPKNYQKGVSGFTGYYNKGMDDRAYKMALLGLTDRQIAGVFGLNVNTIDLWKRSKQSFRDAITAGRIEADGKVAEGFYKKATGYYYEDTAVLTNKVTEYDDNGKPIRSYNEPLLVPVNKHVPPDAWAANKWLSSRQRENWSDTQKVDHRHLVAGSIDLNVDELQKQIGDPTTFSDEELRLVAKMGLEKVQQLTGGSNGANGSMNGGGDDNDHDSDYD